jgi:hypothetical protein
MIPSACGHVNLLPFYFGLYLKEYENTTIFILTNELFVLTRLTIARALYDHAIVLILHIYQGLLWL